MAIRAPDGAKNKMPTKLEFLPFFKTLKVSVVVVKWTGNTPETATYNLVHLHF